MGFMQATDPLRPVAVGEMFKRFVQKVLGQDAPAVPRPEEGRSGVQVRRSNGLREFLNGIQGPPGLRILDLGSASQANLNYIPGMGHKLYTEDLFRDLAPAAPGVRKSAEGNEADGRFFEENLKYSAGHFDGVLCWDLFDFLTDPMVKPLSESLHRLLKPGGSLLAFFHSGKAGQEVSLQQYRIRTEDTLQVTRRGTGTLCRNFNNRTIENLFRDFASFKFYLARDNLREVIILR